MASKKPISGLEDHAGYWLRYVSNHVSHTFAQRVQTQRVTIAEWVLLREILGTGAASPSRIAHQIGMTRGAVSKLVERLCRKKLVRRLSSQRDRRYQTVELTAAGKRLAPVLARLADENDSDFFGHLKPTEKTRLVSMLQGIVRRHGWKDLPVD